MVSKALVRERRAKVANLLLDGLNQYEIAAQVGITQPAVRKHILAIDKEWKEAQKERADAWKGRELAFLQRRIRDNLKAWDRSIEADDDSVGDPRFQALLIKISDQRAKLLGIYAPSELDVKVDAVAEVVVHTQQERLTVEQLTVNGGHLPGPAEDEGPGNSDGHGGNGHKGNGEGDVIDV